VTECTQSEYSPSQKTIILHLEIFSATAKKIKKSLKVGHTNFGSLANIRRSRGYGFEHTLVQKFNRTRWDARRLGGSSTNLPDIVAVNNVHSILLSIEAKSGTSDNLYVPSDQIERCIQIKKMFGVYRTSHAILAFKFMRKKRVLQNGEKTYINRKLQEYYKIADKYAGPSPPNIRCTYDGKTYEIRGDKTRKCHLVDYPMPFQSQR
jgi:Holliday junction resolvase